ncbi:hypothetical protein IWQ62_001999 [Dispira parvispora]|uniref:Small ribosomal subunit protein mS29 n=1 Tax=Dispira parvispora TaxID=1520584 RepID=A0A9W8E8G4_9FUNG|nr:hypothetical protein IWQ62_001999 [Dispira parvispora]
MASFRTAFHTLSRRVASSAEHRPLLSLARDSTGLRCFGTSPALALRSSLVLEYPPKRHTQIKSKAFRKSTKKSTAAFDFSVSEDAKEEDTSVNTQYYQEPVFADIPELVPEMISTATGTGQVCSLPRDLIGQFTSSVFPGSLFQDFSTTHSDGLLIREPLCQVGRLMETPDTRSQAGATVLLGQAGVGKSATLLQAACYAYIKEWLVLYAPKAESWVDASGPYSRSQDPELFTQAEITANWLKFIVRTNKHVLSKATLAEEVTIGSKKLAKGASLEELLSISSSNSALAPQVLDALLTQVQHGVGVPVLLAVDQLGALYTTTEYFNNANERLAPHNLKLVRSILPFFDNQRKLKDGLVLGAVSQADPRFRLPQPDSVMAPFSRGLLPSPFKFQTLTIPPYSREETKNILQYYKESGLLDNDITDELITKRWVLTNGKAAELLRYTLTHANPRMV